MRNNDFLNLKFISKYYIKKKESKLKDLNNIKEDLSLRIEEKMLVLDENKLELQKLQEENSRLRLQYDSLKKLIFQRGIIIDIQNKNNSITQWENLNLHKKLNSYVINSKKGEELYCFDNNYSDLLGDIIGSASSFSLIVIRADSKYIKVQLRFE